MLRPALLTPLVCASRPFAVPRANPLGKSRHKVQWQRRCLTQIPHLSSAPPDLSHPSQRTRSFPVSRQQARLFRPTAPAHGIPALGLVGVYFAKKSIVFIASSLYGFKRLYRHVRRVHNRWVPTRIQPYSAWVVRHTFDAAVKLAVLIDFKAREKVQKAGAELPKTPPTGPELKELREQIKKDLPPKHGKRDE